MQAISISTGLKEFEIVRNGEKAGVIRFNPSDPALLNRLRALRETAKDIHIESTEDIDELLDECARIDAELRAALDKAFDQPVSDIVFGTGFSFATANGVSALEQFINGAVALIGDELVKENTAVQAHTAEAMKAASKSKRVSKYIEKYHSKPDTPEAVKGDE